MRRARIGSAAVDAENETITKATPEQWAEIAQKVENTKIEDLNSRRYVWPSDQSK